MPSTLMFFLLCFYSFPLFFFMCRLLTSAVFSVAYTFLSLLLETGHLGLGVAIGGAPVELATGANSGGQVLEDGDGGVPADAGVGDADALLQGGGALGGHLLVALVDVGLDHDADDGSLALAELLADAGSHLGLVAVVLVGVA